MAKYVDVPATAIEQKLASMGFERGSFKGEVTYSRKHAHCQHTRITVYTTLPLKGGDARGCGEDAIRVIAFYEREGSEDGRRGFKKCLAKPSRVFRAGTVEGVLERLYIRAREAYAAANEFLQDEAQGCFECRRLARGRTIR